MSRVKWKGPYVQFNSLKNLNCNKTKSFIMSRNSILLSKFVGLFLKVHNGKKFVTLKVTQNMVGYKLGEFITTRARYFHKNFSKK